jgi:hypothetical protein
MGSKKSKQQVYLVDHDVQNRDCFEDLSNELIYELFDYLSFHDISLAFGNINNRLQNLIDTYPHYVNLQQHKQTNNLLLPRYIHSLRINAHYQLAFIDLLEITSLRNLILSNIPIFHLLHFINAISLEDLEYIYLGVCPDHHESGENQLKEIQQKILSLGGLKLKKCVFRMKIFVDIDQLPIELSSLEYLRIDGCENILIVNKLVDRMPNLRSLYVSILESTQTNDHHIQQNNKHKCLTNLTIRIQDNVSLEQLIPLFDQNGSRVRNLTIKSNSLRENRSNDQMRDACMVKLPQRITLIINRSLPQLTNFQLRQSVSSQNYSLLQQKFHAPPYVEMIPSSLEHESYRVSIAAPFTFLWQKNFY